MTVFGRSIDRPFIEAELVVEDRIGAQSLADQLIGPSLKRGRVRLSGACRVEVWPIN